MSLIRVDPRTNNIASGFQIFWTGFTRKTFFAMGLTWRLKIWFGLNPARVSERGCETGVGTPRETKNESKEEV